VPLGPPQARTSLGIDDAVLALSPDELISRIPGPQPVLLLGNAASGTSVKASE